jgi:hypothetical protein
LRAADFFSSVLGSLPAALATVRADAVGPCLLIETNITAVETTNGRVRGFRRICLTETMSTSNSTNIWERRFGVSKRNTKEPRIASGPRKFTFWLSSLTALLSFAAGIFCLQATRTTRTMDPEQARFAAENVPNQGTCSLAQAIQALSIRH